MIKKIVKAFSFFALLQIIIYSCCEEVYNVYYKTAEFTIIDVEDYDNTTVASEDLVLQLNFLYNYVNVSQVIDLNQLSNTAYATTCDEDYFFKDMVTNIVITASETIFDIEAGNPINDKLLFINPNTLESESLDNLIAFLNNSNGYAFNPLI